MRFAIPENDIVQTLSRTFKQSVRLTDIRFCVCQSFVGLAPTVGSVPDSYILLRYALHLGVDLGL